jgi:type IV pilus biogenesis protein CpaD/CtpE
MYRTSCLIAGVALAASLAGCSESPPETGTVPFTATTNPAIDALRENMAKTAKSGAYTKKTTEADLKKAEAKAASEKKEAEKKP